MSRLLIVDDHPIFRRGLRVALSDSGAYGEILEAGSCAEARGIVEAGSLDLAVVDLNLPDAIGFELIEGYAQKVGAPRFFVLSMNADRESVRRAFSVGASGYASKNIALDKLDLAFRLVLAGELFIEGELLRDILTAEGARSALRSEARDCISLLSAREMQTLDAMLAGKPSKEIAALLEVSLRSAENYQSSVYKKLGVQNPVELVRLAFRAGLVSRF